MYSRLTASFVEGHYSMGRSRLTSDASETAVCGHPCDFHTHEFTAFKHEGGIIINPGSATSAHSSITYDVNPSLVLSMDIHGLRVVVYVYELIGGEVKVNEIDFK